ncbi:dihydroorotate dehydrogenase B (NAD(+)), catalytic subunit [Synergistales bacterium]|nr:dihydroorotate dehydrogenase B (NAD(+)), catalytic subunit [Synergistales bacterium]
MNNTASGISVDFAGIIMKNPVLLASGTCGFGEELSPYFDIQKLGGIVSKGLTLRPRTGNSGSRLHETPCGLMNSIGLENPGVRHFVEHELPRLKALDIAVIANLGGHGMDDYTEGASILSDACVDMIELNISCPNVKEGGMNFGIKTEIARAVVREVRKVCRHKLAVKLSPNAEDIAALSRACEEEGADGLSLTNTYPAMAIDIYNKKPVFGNIYAGLSGPAIKPISLRMVHQAARAVKIPVMGIGGISNWQDAIEFIMAGATCVQIGTASFMKPDAAVNIIEGIENFTRGQGIRNLSEIRGIIK